MNSVHETKEWQMPPNALPSPSVAESPMHPPVPHYSPMDHAAYPPSFSQGNPLPMSQAPLPPPSSHHHHHPHHHQPTSPTDSSYVKPDSDPRLPGMMAVSQPSTPRPSPAATTEPASSPTRNSNHPASSAAAAAAAAAAVAAYSTPSFHTSSPYMSAGVIPRKRGRSDSLFTQESGPFFSSTKTFDNLFGVDRTNLLSIRIQSKMDRGFFLADNDWTCYRRNYFQVSSAFSIHGMNHYYADHEPQCLVRSEDGNAFYPVRRFLLGIGARVSNNDKRIELVQHTPKRDKGPQMTPQPKPITAGGNLSMSAVGTNQNIVTFERIQFKTATANNGKRRAAQQYYICVTDLFAETDHGEQIRIASCQSAPLVVRGRSPGHYTDSQQERTVVTAPASGAVVPPPPPPHHNPHHHHHAALPPPPPHHNQHPHHHPLPPPSSSSISSPPMTTDGTTPPTSCSQQIALPPPPQHHDDRFAFQRPPYTPPAMMPGDYGYYSSYPQHFSPTMHAPPPPPPMAPNGMMMNNGPPTPTQHTPSSSTGPPPSPQSYAAPPPPPPPPHHHPYMLSSSVARNHSQPSTSAYY
ncbi:hypothetical protein BDB00DRAFT_846824 [Zychaea mexicana]|uniref:uncharacterized protein n=1 Tax=Zychaea mexicana TaxID=64656 RepID=UPI0022FE5191|nr:uncharacterized protein BDB00DRAFT_846824 [Zychaea mexicana]KAI9488753.1 hypothetical protein BDB00DRAFT_846824 [Zychaea mexicana]